MPTRFVRSFAIGSIAFLLAYAVPCQPATADEAPAAIVIETPVTVTATRLPTPENEVGSSVTVITAPEIEAKQERTLPDVLKDVPGLNVVQTGGRAARPRSSSAAPIRTTSRCSSTGSMSATRAIQTTPSISPIC